MRCNDGRGVCSGGGTGDEFESLVMVDNALKLLMQLLFLPLQSSGRLCLLGRRRRQNLRHLGYRCCCRCRLLCCLGRCEGRRRCDAVVDSQTLSACVFGFGFGIGFDDGGGGEYCLFLIATTTTRVLCFRAGSGGSGG